MQKLVDGVLVDLTPKEVAERNADVGVALPPPDEVSNFQGRTLLRMVGLFDAAQGAIQAIEDPLQRAIAQDAFERGAFSRTSALMASIMATLGKTDAERDELFRQAAEITI